MAQRAHADPAAVPLSAVVGANVYARRVLRIPRMSQGTLADLSGVNTDTIGRIEAARDPAKRQLAIRLDTLEAIAAALGCSVADLVRLDATTRVYLHGGTLRDHLRAIHGTGTPREAPVQMPLIATVP